MNKESIGVGLDIGTTKIVAMIGKKNEYGKLEILGVGKSNTNYSIYSTSNFRSRK